MQMSIPDALKNDGTAYYPGHIKDALIVKEQGGLGHKACISGQGDMPFKALNTTYLPW